MPATDAGSRRSLQRLFVFWMLRSTLLQKSLRYSASVLPFAQAALSFKSSGYVTEIKQVMGAEWQTP